VRAIVELARAGVDSGLLREWGGPAGFFAWCEDHRYSAAEDQSQFAVHAIGDGVTWAQVTDEMFGLTSDEGSDDEAVEDEASDNQNEVSPDQGASDQGADEISQPSDQGGGGSTAVATTAPRQDEPQRVTATLTEPTQTIYPPPADLAGALGNMGQAINNMGSQVSDGLNRLGELIVHRLPPRDDQREEPPAIRREGEAS